MVARDTKSCITKSSFEATGVQKYLNWKIKIFTYTRLTYMHKYINPLNFINIIIYSCSRIFIRAIMNNIINDANNAMMQTPNAI